MAHMSQLFDERNKPPNSEIWTPTPETPEPPPLWIPTAPAALLLAMDLIKNGRSLHEMTPREFEQLIASLLELENWTVRLTQQTRDGGFDIQAIKFNDTLGEILTLWEAKRYSPANKVTVNHIRELASVRDEHGATMGVIITTSSLTKDAVARVQREIHRLEAKEGPDIEAMIRKQLGEL